MKQLLKNHLWLLAFFLLMVEKPLWAQPHQVTVTGKVVNSKSLEGRYAYLMVLDKNTRKYNFHQAAVQKNAFQIKLEQEFQDSLISARVFLSQSPAMDYPTYIKNIRSLNVHYFFIDTVAIHLAINGATNRSMVIGGEFNRQKRKYNVVDSVYHVKVQNKEVRKQKGDSLFFSEVNDYKLLGHLEVVKQYPTSLLSVSTMKTLGKLAYPRGYENRDKVLEALQSLSPEWQETDQVKAIYAAYAARLHRMEDKQGQLLPEMALVDQKLLPVSLSNLYADKEYLLLDYWATWCHPCIQQHPEVRKLSEKLKGSKIQIVGISVDDEIEKWQKYLIKQPNFNYPQFRLDPKNKKLLDDLGIGAIPTYILVEKSTGRMVHHKIKFKELEKTLEPYR